MAMEVTVCMGSSCFSKGSNKLVEILEKYENDKTLDIEISMRGCLCKNRCDNGPVVIINDNEYTNIDENSIIDILKQNL